MTHEPLVWGPAAEGERLANGKTLDMPGWVWTCTCGHSGYGYPTEAEAEEWCEQHLSPNDGYEPPREGYGPNNRHEDEP